MPLNNPRVFILRTLWVLWRSPWARIGVFRHLLRRIEYVLIKARFSWIVDEDFYIHNNADVGQSRMSALRHFMLHGIEESRDPSPAFEIQYYRTVYPQLGHVGINPIVHFVLEGRHQRKSPSPLFDYDYYLTANPGIAITGLEPFKHYVQFGMRENRVASPNFDPVRYIRNNPASRKNGLSALAHHRLSGQGNLSKPLAKLDASSMALSSSFEADNRDYEAEIAELPVREHKHAQVEVIVPVFRGVEPTLSCLWHVLRAKNRTPFKLTVVDDRTPEPGLAAALARLAEAGHFKLLVNDENLGFVKSANRAMRDAAPRDVILLNSDTQVYGDWIDRLGGTAQSNSGCGTVTPFTNNGTICSYPHFAQDNPWPLEIDYQDLDGLARQINGQETPPKLPTAVGFCMYIRRALLDDIGYFDEKAFGTGYGEENDFCLRAQKAGWHDLLAANVFVRHFGGTSFLGEKPERVQRAAEVLDKRYPRYHRDIQAFIKSDPIKPLRTRIDIQRLLNCRGPANSLMISHSRGGGTEQHVLEETARLKEQGVSVFQMRAVERSEHLVRHRHAQASDLPNLPDLDISKDHEEIVDLWNQIGIEDIWLHHVADFGAEGPRNLHNLLRRSGRPWRFVIHDYLAICPRINLADAKGFYCGEPNVKGCNHCLRVRGSEFGPIDVSAWRAQFQPLLSEAVDRIVPDRDVAERMNRYFPDLHFTVRPHDNVRPASRTLPTAAGSGRKLRIGVLGAISDIKGLPVLLASAREAEKHQMPLQFVVVGYTRDDVQTRQAGIEITGPYTNDRVQDLIASQALDAIFIPSTWPETYSYTLSIAFRTNLPIIAFDIGAIANRLRGVPDTLLLPLEMAGQPARVVGGLFEYLTEMERSPSHA